MNVRTMEYSYQFETAQPWAMFSGKRGAMLWATQRNNALTATRQMNILEAQRDELIAIQEEAINIKDEEIKATIEEKYVISEEVSEALHMFQRDIAEAEEKINNEYGRQIEEYVIEQAQIRQAINAMRRDGQTATNDYNELQRRLNNVEQRLYNVQRQKAEKIEAKKRQLFEKQSKKLDKLKDKIKAKDFRIKKMEEKLGKTVAFNTMKLSNTERTMEKLKESEKNRDTTHRILQSMIAKPVVGYMDAQTLVNHRIQNPETLNEVFTFSQTLRDVYSRDKYAQRQIRIPIGRGIPSGAEVENAKFVIKKTAEAQTEMTAPPNVDVEYNE